MPPPPMLASLSGSLALVLGLVVMLMPLLSPELSRPRDSAWGAVIVLLGLTLITGADRLSGSPMLAVLCAGLLIGRLGGEVMQLRWRQLTSEEQQRLGSLERWRTSLQEVAVSLGRGGSAVGESLSRLYAALRIGRGRGTPASPSKRWVRPEAAGQPQSSAGTTPVVGSFTEIEALIEASRGEAG